MRTLGSQPVAFADIRLTSLTLEGVMVPDASIAFAAVTWMASRAGGPPTRPRARLAANAVRVRSRRSSTSNCPRAAKMWRVSPRVALVGSSG
jgi:hypothetical protein